MSHTKDQFAPSKEPDLSSTGQGWTTTLTTLSSLASNAKNTRHLTLRNPSPGRPFQELAADFCSYASQDFLILVDCYSDWPDVVHMGHNTTTLRLITALKKDFCRSGVPDILWSDQGPQFTSKLFQDFSKGWGFQHITSSPQYPQSNGKIEATVKSMKKLIEASWMDTRLDEGKLTRAIHQYRNTSSCRDGLSPAQKLFSAHLRTAQATL